jgi:hypothetical protein
MVLGVIIGFDIVKSFILSFNYKTLLSHH